MKLYYAVAVATLAVPAVVDAAPPPVAHAPSNPVTRPHAPVELGPVVNPNPPGVFVPPGPVMGTVVNPNPPPGAPVGPGTVHGTIINPGAGGGFPGVHHGDDRHDDPPTAPESGGH